MATVIEDLATGATLEAEPGGITVTRAFVIKDVTGAKALRLANAYNAGSLPRVGDRHPAIPGISVTSIRVDPAGDESGPFRATVTYSRPDVTESPPSDGADLGTLQVGSSVQQTTTEKDKDGTQLIVKIKMPDGTEKVQAGEMEFLIPQAVIQLQRKERVAPLYKALQFTGSVNRSAIGSFPERTLLCTELEGQSTDGGLTYDVSYVFQFKPDKWDGVALYKDKQTDKAHSAVNLTNKNGVLIARLYPETDFSRLGINFNFPGINPAF